MCGKPRQEKHHPFCSKRCAEVDLSRWLSGVYAIPGDPVDAAGEEDEGR
ncbi:MAG: DNA gyrase inhibitor YacG [Pseudomonadota bacterium]|nr:DNA gyrase inhibitor YacG [Pseudomonadota bacterium]